MNQDAIYRTDTRGYAHGTSLMVRYPWGINVAGRAMCPDGTVRALSRIAPTADTFFSIPAAVKVRGKTVSGYVTFTTASGLSIETAEDPQYLEFCPHNETRHIGEFFTRLALDGSRYQCENALEAAGIPRAAFRFIAQVNERSVFLIANQYAITAQTACAPVQTLPEVNNG